jgi:prepilin-type N-terminal cleavage/methylation domain-containing protein/prepilin-type processing-associated H-X9-DG protein
MPPRYRSPRHPTDNRAAFTLVELLVVIGIIALLISILLPALGAVRKQAEATKCSAALREIGAAVLNYVNDNRGYAPPAKVATGRYNLDGIVHNAASDVANVSTTASPYWYSFLAKYATKNRLGNASTSAAEAADAQKSILWGCPAFQKYISIASLGGFSRLQPGFGINHFPTYTPYYPDLGTSYPGANDSTVVGSSNHWVQSHPTSGTWHKFTRYTKPAQRCLVADAQFWIVEAQAPPASGDIPGQKTYNNIETYSLSGQTLFDFYRHGTYPPIQVRGSSGYYAKSGGKVSYNILYCDGHVTNVSDRAEAYRSIRQRFPR